MAQGVASSWHAAGVVAALVFASLCVIRAGWTLSARYLHVLQLNSYQIDGYWRSLRRYAAEDLHPLFAVFAACVVCATALGVLLEALAPSFMGAAFAGAAVLFAIFSQLLKKKRGDKAQKKALVDTERMLRLKRTHRMALFAWSVVAGLCAAGAYFLLRAPLSEPIAVFAASFLLYLPFALLAQTVAVSARLRQGPERRINQGFIDEAKRILRARSDLIRIGITGSYGKTSSKFILGTLLSRRFQTLVPPGSYNTPMGVVRMVREMLKPSHQVMIAEMGARHESEIAELCNIVRPQYSLLTAIGRQHMETFGSFENIVKTKYEIMQALDENGVGFFPNDGGTCLELYRKFDGHKVLFGIGREENDVWAEDIASDAQGSAFVLCNAGRRQPCRTRLLGRHNVMNILGCAAVAMQLGMDLEEIAQGIAQVEPVEHRLQLINPGTGVLVIDDAFNSNPEGTRMAMEVLSMFEGFRKICVTPGMVELGDSEFTENRRFGQRMAQACDIVILVGQTRAIPLAEGLKAEGFPAQNMHIVSDLEEATALLATVAKPGDVVLFENDLPDHYAS